LHDNFKNVNRKMEEIAKKIVEYIFYVKFKV
jgi:hypothetical protein